MLRDWVLTTATFTEAIAVLVLQDESGNWYRESSGFSPEELGSLDSALSKGLDLEASVRQLPGAGLQFIEAIVLVDVFRRAIGTLCILSHAPLALSGGHREGLRLVAGHIESILAADRQGRETRATPRAPSASSFVPGLVHEFRNFIFGISANLDAFDARFAGQDEAMKYGTTIRRGLDRLSAFIEELKEYGDPQVLSWVERDLEPLLQEAIEHHRAPAVGRGVDLRLHVEGALPTLNVDEQSLRAAFIRLIDLALQQEDPGGSVLLHVEARLLGGRGMVCGHLDGSSMKLEGMDLARLFEPFHYRASGLGRLALPGARRVFESHGGSLSAGPGPLGGLRICFMLPAVLTYPLPSADQA